jgi:hypothetical protein
MQVSSQHIICMIFYVLVQCTQVNMMLVMLLWVYTLSYTLRVTSQASYYLQLFISHFSALVGLSVLQNGKLPQFLSKNIIGGIFDPNCTSQSLINLRKGLGKVGIFQVGIFQ